MIQFEEYYKIRKLNVDIVLKDNVKFAGYFISALDRELEILFRDITDEDVKKIEDRLDNAYMKWSDDDMGYCCEEYMLEKLPKKYKDKMLAVFYIGDDDNE